MTGPKAVLILPRREHGFTLVKNLLWKSNPSQRSFRGKNSCLNVDWSPVVDRESFSFPQIKWRCPWCWIVSTGWAVICLRTGFWPRFRMCHVIHKRVVITVGSGVSASWRPLSLWSDTHTHSQTNIFRVGEGSFTTEGVSTLITMTLTRAAVQSCNLTEFNKRLSQL